jgi:hypothetical protein
VLEAVPLDEQERMYEVLAAARKRVEAADIDTTATRVTNGPDRSSPTIDPSPGTAEVARGRLERQPPGSGSSGMPTSRVARCA